MTKIQLCGIIYTASNAFENENWKPKYDHMKSNADIDYCQLKLDKNAAEPLHLQLNRELSRQMRGLPPNCEVKLLSERKLSELLRLDRSTTHRAYSELKKARLIEMRSNRSLYVARDVRRKLQQPFPNIGIVIPERFSEFIDHNQQIPMYYLKGIFDQTGDSNISTIMLQLPPVDAPEDYIQQYLQEVVGRLNGVIHLGDRGYPNDPPLEMLFECTTVPQIFISGFSRRPHIGMIYGDIISGGQSLCEQLRELGHRRVGIISFFSKMEQLNFKRHFYYECFNRIEKMLAIFQEYEMVCRPEWQLYLDRDLPSIGRRLSELQKNNLLPTAFWCVNDVTARETIRALNALGFRVPEDISVIGFDGENFNGQEPELTTIKLPFYAIGSRAVRLLQEYNESGISRSNREVKLPTSLVMCRTLGPAASRSLRSNI